MRWGELQEDVEIDLTASPASAVRSLEIEYGAKWEMSAELDIFGSKVGPKYAATMKASTISEYKLPAGRRYYAQRFERLPWWWWKTE